MVRLFQKMQHIWQRVKSMVLKNQYNVGINYENQQDMHDIGEEHVVLSEHLEDPLKAIEWACEQREKIINKRSTNESEKPTQEKELIQNGGIGFPKNLGDLSEQNYVVIQQKLLSAGFCNIACEVLYYANQSHTDCRR